MAPFAMPPLRAGETWFFAGETERGRVGEVEAACAGRTIGNVCDVAVGVVSGRDGAYLPDASTAAAIAAEAPDLMVDFVKAAGCVRYGEAQTTPMLFPHGVADEAELMRRSPTAATHLLSHRETLTERYMAGSAPWFSWATVRNMPAFERHAGKGRVFVPAIDRAPAPRFSYTEHPTALAAGDTLMIAPKADPGLDPLFLRRRRPLSGQLAALFSRWAPEWQQARLPSDGRGSPCPGGARAAAAPGSSGCGPHGGRAGRGGTPSRARPPQ